MCIRDRYGPSAPAPDARARRAQCAPRLPDSRGGRARRRSEHRIGLHELEPRLPDLLGGAEHLAVEAQPVAAGDLGDLLSTEADLLEATRQQAEMVDLLE